VEDAFRLEIVDELTQAAEEADVLQPFQASPDRSGVGHLSHLVMGRRRDGGGAS
jgi:hypothetical protein